MTHDQTEAMTLGDRVAVMRAGVLQQVGPPAELYAQPANLFVAGFIGSPGMNFLPGKLKGSKVSTPFGDLRRPSGPEKLEFAARRRRATSLSGYGPRRSRTRSW